MLPCIMIRALISGGRSNEFAGHHGDFCLPQCMAKPSAIQPVCWRVRISPHGESVSEAKL